MAPWCLTSSEPEYPVTSPVLVHAPITGAAAARVQWTDFCARAAVTIDANTALGERIGEEDDEEPHALSETQMATASTRTAADLRTAKTIDPFSRK